MVRLGCWPWQPAPGLLSRSDIVREDAVRREKDERVGWGEDVALRRASPRAVEVRKVRDTQSYTREKTMIEGP
jgi:hypothetical protein